ncbi:unnamed protein product [Linum tenue]|uniref:RNase H type-1 domain-containing protein n=1 Tax=Linum tenue TaxID=586396 RepID=A0AAV0RQB0_9ROSI|nr:unnamed protein product [Linum tenue]
MSHGALLTNAERQRRHLTPSSRCARFKEADETPEHTFRTCKYAQQVWRQTVPDAASPSDRRSLKDWFFYFLKHPAKQVRFGFTCWFLWRSRNDYVFSDIEEPSSKLSQRILAWEIIAQKSKAAEQAISLGRSGLSRDVAVGWRPAPTGWITVNSDGSLLRLSESTAVGGALRDGQGRLLGAFSMNLGRCTITRAEIWGALRGLQMAWDSGRRRVELQLDSTTAITLLSPGSPTNH